MLMGQLAGVEMSREWLMRPVLPTGYLVLVSGDPKFARKTLAMTHLGMCLASSRPFFDFNPERKVPVVYSYLEDDKHEANARIRALGMPPDLNIPYIGTWGQADAFAMIDKIKNQGEPGVWIIDTLVELLRLHEVDDENSSSQMAEVLGAYRNLTRHTGWTILITHHNRKQGDVMRGSTAIKGACDSWWEIRWNKQSEVRQFDCVLKGAASVSFGTEYKIDGVDNTMTIETIAHDSPQWTTARDAAEAGRRANNAVGESDIRQCIRNIMLVGVEPDGGGVWTLQALREVILDRFSGAQCSVDRVRASTKAMRDSQELTWGQKEGFKIGPTLVAAREAAATIAAGGVGG